MALKNLATLDDALKHPTEAISLAAVGALRQLLIRLLVEADGKPLALAARKVGGSNFHVP